MIKADKVTKIYNKSKVPFVALDAVSLEIADNESVAILGKSGSGKSTLMHILAGLDSMDSGAVVVDGLNIQTLKNRQLNKFRNQSIGFVFQTFYTIPNESVYQNVSLPLQIAGVKRSRRKELVHNALQAVDLYDKVDSKITELSGGQRQRVCIARAIVNNPRLIFADEPTGNLDTQTGRKIEDLLFEYNRNQGATLVIVTHDDDLAMRCKRQIHISDGKIIE